ncbi:sensor histidine kinase [Amycolatopsis sp. NPDC059657]|uniref:sensor histidine kinase n=1 Tax=Amycolatopsis sp. NPDC059657 TaxID=3346899 RepID=UPI00366B8923
MATTKVPWRKRLLTRLLAVSVLIAIGSIAATAWLAVQTTTKAIEQEKGQALSDDATVYTELLGRAAGSPSWGGVGPLLHDLASRTGRRIILTGEDRAPIADSGGAPILLPAQASAVVDPLRADPILVPEAGTSGIDPRAVGPFRLSDEERTRLDSVITKQLECLRGFRITATVRTAPNGKPSIDFNGFPLVAASKCGLFGNEVLTPTEEQALGQLTDLVNTCLQRQGLQPVKLDLTFTALGAVSDPQAARACVEASRREQLRTFVAPPALLFVTSESGQPSNPFNLSRANTTRIIAVTVGVLGLTVLITVLLATRVSRPLRTLTEAVRRNRPAPVTTRDEIGYLATAFNDLSERRKIMVSDIAHELRNPLSAIQGRLEAAEDGIIPLDRALTTSLLEETLLLHHIVEDLQDLAAADAGSLRLHPEPVHLSDLLDQVAESYRDRAGVAEVSLTVETDGDPEILADPVRLRQIMGNLVSNAIRHTPGGTVSVRARAEDVECVIEVADTGAGISEADLPQVFDRFWRAEKSRSRQTGGSGLGLAIVRQLTEAHGGTVSVTSVLGEGSVFTVRLPVTTALP